MKNPRVRSEAYLRTIAIDSQVTALLQQYRESKNQEALGAAYEALRHITLQEIAICSSKLHLNEDLKDDMYQDSFLKFKDVAECYQPERCPVFVSFWRISLRNFLLKWYYSSRINQSLIDEEEGSTCPVARSAEAADLLREIYVRYFVELQDPLFLAIFTRRIMKPTSEKIGQAELALEFHVTQGFISRNETWLLEKIQADFAGSF